MRWRTERTEEFKEWWEALTDLEGRKVLAAIDLLEQIGPVGGRPAVDSVKGSRYPNMKELRVPPTIRVFFAFDPRRVAVLLTGGDKAGKTSRFYGQMLPKADKIYDLHLRRLSKGGTEYGQG